MDRTLNLEPKFPLSSKVLLAEDFTIATVSQDIFSFVKTDAGTQTLGLLLAPPQNSGISSRQVLPFLQGRPKEQTQRAVNVKQIGGSCL